jgi:CRISPR/Cas system-associated endonuclease Cas1
MGERKNGNLPRSWLRFAQRNKGAAFLGNQHASHPLNAMLNYCYIVEAGRLAKALAAQGLCLSIGFLHSDKKGRNRTAAPGNRCEGLRLRRGA